MAKAKRATKKQTSVPKALVKAVKAAGGTVVERGEFVPGEPYAFVRDPDGYTVEIWYELPTPADPPDRPRRARAR